MESEHMDVDLRAFDVDFGNGGAGEGSGGERLSGEEGRGEEVGGGEAIEPDDKETVDDDKEAAFIKLQEEVAAMRAKPDTHVDTSEHRKIPIHNGNGNTFL